MFGFIGKIFGTSNDRNLKRMQKFVDAINSLDEDYSSKEDSFYSELKSFSHLVGSEPVAVSSKKPAY